METLIVIAEDAVSNYRNVMMERLSCDQDDLTLLEYADELFAIGNSIELMLSKISGVALEAFRNHFKSGNTMFLVDPKTFNQLEHMSANNIDYRIAIFWADGSPVGVVYQDKIIW